MKNTKYYLVILLAVFTATQSLWSLDFPVMVYDKDLNLPLEGVRIQEIETGTELYTDFEGKVVFDLPEMDRAILLIELVGYEAKKQLITDFSKPLDIYMLMEGVLEGEELVIEVDAIGETDAEVGVSTVVEEEVIQSAAKIGFVEDAMSAVKILPGVTYSGGMASTLSIRGSDFNGFSAVMDGMKIGFPYHFGGMVSIFNPNIVESIKFSPGIFSVKHGEATSALLEVNTIVPDDGFKLSLLSSTSTSEAFFQLPFADNKVGILGGLRLTFWEPAIRLMGWIGEQADVEELRVLNSSFAKYPHIYDFYFKGFYRPSNSFYWYLNAFSGNDGIGFKVPELPGDDKSKEVLNKGEFLYSNNDFFVSTGLSLLPREDLLIDLKLGQEIWYIGLDTHLGLEGTQKYDDDFIAKYNPPSDSAYVDQELFKMDMNQVKYSTQGRADIDWSIKDGLLLQSGFGTTFATSTWKQKGYEMEFQKVSTSDESVFMRQEIDKEGNGDKSFASFVYANINADLSSKLSLEAGCRLDHFYLQSEDEKVNDVNTPVIPAPRARFIFNPGINNNFFTDNSFTLGIGMFNTAPWTTGNNDLSEKTLMTVLGWDTKIPFGMHFKVEGYYKYVYDRTYKNTPIFADSGLDDIQHTNGYGHIAGGDLLLERKISRYIDGMLSYTFVWARYKEPTLENGYKYDIDLEAPRGEFYWPEFHRYHSLNLLFNVKPTNNFTITTKFTFASGLPKRKFEEKPVMHVNDSNGKKVPMQLYESHNVYSDSNRAAFEMPLDIKFTWHNYMKESKYNWEFYIGVERVLSPLLAKLNTSSSEEGSLLKSRSDNQDSSFSSPVPSIGFRLTF